MSLKKLHSCVKPECWELDTEYTLTLNLKDSDFKSMERKVFEYLRLLANLKYCRYELYFELSQLGRLHMHGVIWIEKGEKNNDLSNIAKFFAYDMSVLTTYFAFEIDEIGACQKCKGEDEPEKSPEKTTGEDNPEDCPHGVNKKEHRHNWECYCTKQSKIMLPFLSNLDLPHRVTNDKVDFYINNKATPELKRFLR